MTFRSFLRQLTSDSFVYSFSTVSSRLIGILLFPFFAREFSPDDYAVINFINTTTIFLSLFCSMGLDSAVYRWYFDKTEEAYHKKVFSVWLFSVVAVTFVAALFFFVTARLYVTLHLKAVPDADLLLAVVSFGLLINVVPGVTNTYLVLRRMPKQSVALSLLSTVLSVLCSVLFVFRFHWGVTGFFSAQVVAFTVSAALGYLFYLKHVISLKEYDTTLFKKMFRYGITIVPGPVSSQLLLVCTGLIINLLVSGTTLGYYQVAATIASCIALISTPFNQAFQPLSLSVMHTENAKSFYITIFDIYCFFMSLLCLVLSLFYNDLIRIFLTGKYLPSVVPAGLLSFSSLIAGLNMIAITGMSIAKKMHHFGKVMAGANLISIPLVFILTNQFGVLGTCVVFLFTQSAIISLLFYYSERVYSIKYRFGANVIIITTAITGFLLYVFNDSVQGVPVFRLIIILSFLAIACLSNPHLFREMNHFLLLNLKAKLR